MFKPSFTEASEKMHIFDEVTSPSPPNRPQTSVGGCRGGARLLSCAGWSQTCLCKVPAFENPFPENLPTPACPRSRRRRSTPADLHVKNVTKQRKANRRCHPLPGGQPLETSSRGPLSFGLWLALANGEPNRRPEGGGGAVRRASASSVTLLMVTAPQKWLLSLTSSSWVPLCPLPLSSVPRGGRSPGSRTSPCGYPIPCAPGDKPSWERPVQGPLSPVGTLTETAAPPGSQNALGGVQGAQGFPTLDATKCRADSTVE